MCQFEDEQKSGLTQSRASSQSLTWTGEEGGKTRYSGSMENKHKDKLYDITRLSPVWVVSER